MTPQYLITLAHWGVNIAFWPAVIFTPVVSTVWPWWKSFWGVNIVTLEIAIALALAEPAIATDFGWRIVSNVAAAWLEVSSLWLVGAIIVWRGLLVVSAQLTGTYGIGIYGVTRMLLRFKCPRCRLRLVKDDDEKSKCRR